MYKCTAIKEMVHTNEKHWYFPLRAIFILWTGSLQQHDISRAPGHMVPQPSLPGVPVARETDEVEGSPGGRGAKCRGQGAEVRRSVVLLIYISTISPLCTLHAISSGCIPCVIHQ